MESDPIHLKHPAPTFREWRPVAALQALFFITALIGLNGPLDSMHYLRQCQTFDVARHVFRDGWSAVFTPRASFTEFSVPDDTFSPLVLPAPRFTIIHLEVPFHGLFAWPAALLFPGQELVIVRLVSVVFALLSISLVYLVLRHWLDAAPALGGTALWTTAPLFIHCGQVPMPDVLAITGLLLAFLLALRGSIGGSSSAFLFTILAKLSLIVYGLPVLAALLIARECRSIGQFVKISLLWGLGPLLGITGWLSLSRHDPYGSWVVFGGFAPGPYGPPGLADWLDPKFYLNPLLYVFVFGGGIMGIVGLLFALGKTAARLNPVLKGSIILALLANYGLEKVVWFEPQYALPVIFWLVLAASFGFSRLLEIVRENRSWRIPLACLLVLHLALVCVTTNFLRSSRVPNVRDVEAAAQLTPPDARVVVYAKLPAGIPSAWMDRNTLKVAPFETYSDSGMDKLNQRLQGFRQAGFNYLIVFDVQGPHRGNPLRATDYDGDLTSASSPFRRYFDQKYQKLFEANNVVLYSLGP